MNIRKTTSNKRVTFGSLSKGTVFKTAENNAYYMKTDAAITTDTIICTAVLLNDGTMISFRSQDLVYVVDCELCVQ